MKGCDVKNFLLLMITISVVGCSTVATQSEDGRTLTIKGSGKASFENGASIEGGTWLPKLPKIEVD